MEWFSHKNSSRWSSSAPGGFATSILLVLSFVVVQGMVAQSYTTAQLADGFDYPVGKPNAENYYMARGFSSYGHMGEDWNGNGMGDTDLGDPVYSTANGVVVYSAMYPGRGWGNVVIIRHGYRQNSGQIAFIDSLYGHLHRRAVSLGQKVSRGQLVGTIGKGKGGIFPAHLHFEIRKDLRVGMRRDMYPQNLQTYYSPRHFIDANRTLRYEQRHVRIPINTFLRSNPNRVLTTQVDPPKKTTTTTVRPEVPEPVAAAIKEETSSEATKPAKSKSLFQKLFGN